MAENSPLDSFLDCMYDAYQTTEDWLAREVIFAFAAGVCGAYYKLNLPLTLQQTMLLARKLWKVYINNLNKPEYLIPLKIPSPQKDLLNILSTSDVWLGIDDEELDSLAIATFQEIVLESLQVSIIAFNNKIPDNIKSIN